MPCSEGISAPAIDATPPFLDIGSRDAPGTNTVETTTMMKQVPQPELKSMLVEASHALAHLDADRLEEMALSCAALVCDVDGKRCGSKTQGKSGPFEAAQEMTFFASI